MEEEIGFSITGEVDPATAAVNKLTASMDKLNATMAQANDKIGGTEAPTNKMTGSFLKAEIAFAAVQKVAGALFDVIKSGIHEVEETEQAMMRASVAAGKAGVSMGQLQKAAEGIVTPLIEGEQKLNIISDLVSRGFDPSQAQQMANAMTDIVAAGKDAGTSLQEGMLKATDAIVKGRIAGDDMVRMFPSLKALGADALKALSQGTADAATKQAALNAVMRDAGPAAGSAAKYFESFAGIMELAKVTFADLTEALAGGFLNAIGPLISSVTDAMGSMEDWKGVMTEIGSVVGQVLVQAFNAIKAVLDAVLNNGISPLSIAWKALGSDSSTLADKIGVLVDFIGGTLVTAFKLAAAGAMIFGNAGTILENIWLGVKSKILEAVNDVLEGLISVTGKIGDIAPQASDAYSALRDAQTALQPSIRETNKAYDESSVSISNLYDGVKELLDGGLEPITQKTKEYGGAAAAAKPPVAALTEEQKKLLQSFMDALRPMDEMTAKFHDLAAVGITYDQFIRMNADSILEAADAQVKHGEALTKDQEAMVNAAIAAQEQQNAFEGSAAALELQTQKAEAAVEANNNLANAQDKISDILRSSADDMSSLQDAIAFYGDGVNALNPDLQEMYDRLLAAESALTDQAAANGRAAAAARDAAEAFNNEMQAVEGLGNFLGFLSGVAGQFSGVMGDMIKGVQGGVKVFEDMRKNGFSKTEAAIGGLGSALQTLGSQFGGAAGEAMQAAGAIAQAWAQGGPVAAAITGATILFSKLLSLFGHDWGKDAAKQVSLLTNGLKVSDELMKKIADDGKKMGNAMASALIHLPDIFAELGVNMDNFTQLAGSVMDVFSGVEQGIISTAQANEILADTFPQLLDAALEFGGAYLDQLNQIVATAAQTGIGVDTIRDALTSAIDEIEQKLGQVASDLNASLTPMIAQLSNDVTDFLAQGIPQAAIAAGTAFKTLSADQIATFNKMIADGKTVVQIISEMGLSVTQVSELLHTLGGPIPAAEDLADLRTTAEGLAETVLTSFNAMIASGMSLSDALSAIGPNMDDLREVFKALGITFADVGLGWLNQMEMINSKFPQQIAAINGVQQALLAMNTAGITPSMTQFQALENTALAAFDKIRAGHEPTKAELASMAPTLSMLAQNAAKYGYALDPDIQKLIEMAEKQGIVIDTDPAPTLEDTMVSLLDVLGDLKDMLAQLATGAQSYAGALNEIPTSIDTTVAVHYDVDNPPEGMGGFTSQAGLVGMHRIEDPAEAILAHKGEAIVDEDIADALEGKGGSTSSVADMIMAPMQNDATVESNITVIVKLDSREIARQFSKDTQRGRVKVARRAMVQDLQ